MNIKRFTEVLPGGVSTSHFRAVSVCSQNGIFRVLSGIFTDMDWRIFVIFELSISQYSNLMSKYYFTGAQGRRYTCTLLIFRDCGEDVYSFRIDYDGNSLNIIKRASGWAFHSGRDLYLDRWISELGEQVDSGKHL